MTLTKEERKAKHKDALLNDFAIRSFRNIADGDYISARLSYRFDLIPQFLWSSLQAIEKYIKCILLLNRIKAKKMGHNLTYGLNKINRDAPFKLQLSRSTNEFIEYLDTYGRHKYFETPYHTRGFEIFYLDKSVWEIRRYCTVLNYDIEKRNGKTVNMLEHEISRITQSDQLPHYKFKLPTGTLEEIISKPKHSSRDALLWQNAFFGKKYRKTVRLVRKMHGANSPLSMHPDILDDVLQYVYLPGDVVKHYKNANSNNNKAI